MNKYILFLLLVFTFNSSFANSIILKDVECNVVSGLDAINIKPGDLTNFNCDRIGNEISCDYTDKSGNKVNKGDKYFVVFDDNKTNAVWISSTSNIIIHIDYINYIYQIGQIFFSSKNMMIINKFCVGTIVSY